MTGKTYIETYKYIKKRKRIHSNSIQCRQVKNYIETYKYINRKRKNSV